MTEAANDNNNDNTDTDEANFLRGRIVLDLLLELCAAPTQPLAKPLCKFVASVLSAFPQSFRQAKVRQLLQWAGEQLLKGAEADGNKVSSTVAMVARKAVRAAQSQGKNDGDDDNQDEQEEQRSGANAGMFQALKMRVMARRATINALKMGGASASTTTTTSPSPSISNGSDASLSTSTSENSDTSSSSSSSEVQSSAAATLAKSRAMLARLKQKKNRGTTTATATGALQDVGNNHGRGVAAE